MIYQLALDNPLKYDTIKVQGFVNFFWYIVVGIVACIIVGYLFSQLYKRMTYNYHVFFYKKIGDTELVFEDQAKQVKLEGNYMFHYMKLNKYSSVFSPKYFRIVQKPILGIFPNSKISFNAYLMGESVFPMTVSQNPGLAPVNLDQFNYMQTRIQANMQKYAKSNLLLQLSPIIGLGLVVLMFIIGLIFYTKHVEAVAQMILNSAKETAATKLTSSGAVQVIPGT